MIEGPAYLAAAALAGIGLWQGLRGHGWPRAGSFLAAAVLAVVAGWGSTHDTHLAPSIGSLAQLRAWMGR